MEEYKHFSHPHNLSFYQSLEGAELTCSGCNLPCTDTPIYSCHPCKFFLHKQCFDAARALIHPLHPDHPLSLFPSPTYPSGSFICGLCDKIGLGLCFCFPFVSLISTSIVLIISTVTLDPKRSLHHQIRSTSKLTQTTRCIIFPSHVPYDVSLNLTCSCDICGTVYDSNDPLYHCDICEYDAHVECVNLPETVKREDHAHELSLNYVNPYGPFECDICKGVVAKNHCFYLCKSGCEYAMHITCVSASVKVPEKSAMNQIDQLQVEMLKIHSQMLVNQTAVNSMAAMGFHHYHRDRYSGI